MHSIYSFRFVITTGHKERVRIGQLHRKHCDDRLNGVSTSINKVAVKEIVMILRWIAIKFKNFDEIEELAMHISTHRDSATFWNINTNQVWLCLKQLFSGIEDLNQF